MNFNRTSFLVLFILSVVILSSSAYASFTRSVTISSTNTLTNYQVRISTDTSNAISLAHMNSDCSDISFTDSDGVTPLNSWIESGCNSGSTVMWVKVPSISAGVSKTINMNYGTGTSVSHDPSMVFDFYDDFSGSSLDSTKWSGSASVSGGTATTTSSITTVSTFSGDIIVNTRMKYNGGSSRGGLTVGNNAAGSFLFVRGDSSSINWNIYDPGWGGETGITGSSAGTYYDWVEYFQGTNAYVQFSGSSSGPRTMSSTARTISIGTYGSGTSFTVDNVIARRYSSSEPTTTVGAETGVGTPTASCTPGAQSQGNGTYVYTVGGGPAPCQSGSVNAIKTPAAPASNGAYYREITVDNSNGEKSYNDFQVQVMMDTATPISQGLITPDCVRMRFYDSDRTTQLNHWVESGCNTEKTNIWVKVPFIQQGAKKTIFVYYGSSAYDTQGNPDSVFDFFDNFNSGLGKWVGINNANTQNGNAVVGANLNQRGAGMTTSSSFTGDLTFESRMKFTTSPTAARSGITLSGNGKASHLFLRGTTAFGGGVDTMQWNTLDGGWNAELTISAGPADTWAIWKLNSYSDTTGTPSANAQYADDNNKPAATPPRGLNLGSRTFSMSIYDDADARQFIADWVRVRKYANVDPTTTVGPENAPPSSQTNLEVARFLDTYEWCSGTCSIANTQNAQSNVQYHYYDGTENPTNGNWYVTSSTPMGKESLRSGNINNNQASRMVYTVYLPESVTQNYVYSLSFDYKVSAEPKDIFSVFLTKTTGPSTGPIDLIYTQGQRCVFQTGQANAPVYKFNDVQNQLNPCSHIEPGYYTIDFVYTKDGDTTSFDDTAYVDNLQINVVPV